MHIKTNRTGKIISLFALFVILLSTVGCRPKETEISSIPENHSTTNEDATEVPMGSFYDAQGNYFTYELQNYQTHDYNLECLNVDGSYASYDGDSRYTYQLGIDVSAYQGTIDWNRVKAAGYDFVFIRIGYRGYGEAGNMKEDACFSQNYAGAKAAGLEVGVYFFSQAINEDEALEEADFVLEILSANNITPSDLDLPVVFDPESITTDDARTDNVSGEQFTANTVAFYHRMEENGYTSMIFCNMYWEAFMLDLYQLEDHELWYADYSVLPQTPYAFSYWQYSESSTVDGIEVPVDTDIRFLPLDN